MVPSQLKPESFSGYPPQARGFAVKNIAVLQQMPLALLPSYLNEVIGYDWKLPAERAQVEREMQTLAGLSAAEFQARMEAFTALHVSPEIAAVDWVNAPATFLEQLTAWLWSTHQMDAFHAAANAYTAYLGDAAPVVPLSEPRVVIVVVGKGVEQTSDRLFRKLRPQGTYFTKVKPEAGVELILAHAATRAASAKDKDGFAHWYIDGGTATTVGGLTQVSYDALAGARAALLDRTQQTITSGSSGPEALRSLLAQLKPEDVGLGGTPGQEVLDRFQLSLLTQGSGTQIFSTTFVQWAGRECLRRAQPSTLVLRYAPRQQQQTMNAMLSGAPAGGLDPEGSLVDADMGAYYTWLNLRKLSGADTARFLVWFEGHNLALAIAPDLPRGTVADSAIDMKGMLALLN